MHPAELFELILGMVIAVSALYWIAERLRLPPSATILVGGSALAFIPGVPEVRLDPGLVLVLFLPPLLSDGAWFTDIARSRRHIAGILSLAVGAVLFSTLVVAGVAHWLVPALPWAACAALGAIVSPPDAISARAVLSRVRLPRRLSALLEGESLLNDATGLVIFRFAVAAAAGGPVSAGPALGGFFILVVGGCLVGTAVGALWTWLARRLRNELLLVISSIMVCWVAYIAAERLETSGVIATIVASLILSWQQHDLFTAAARNRAVSLWQVLVFLLEASVFVLIGFSLRDVLTRTGGIQGLDAETLLPIAIILVSIVAARFVWVFASDTIVRIMHRLTISREPAIGVGASAVIGWAGMRGVVTLAAALTLPDDIPGRDLILLTAFATILATVLVQGSTLGLVIHGLGVRRAEHDEPPLSLLEAEAAIMQAQLVAVQSLAHDEKGELIHPQLLERYTHRAKVGAEFDGTDDERALAIASHFDVIIEAVRAGRTELMRLHRSQQIDDETTRDLERDLDLEEMVAIAAKIQ